MQIKENKNYNIKIIIGLGNPGPKFFNTRHNIGFQILDYMHNEFNGTAWITKKNYSCAYIIINNKKFELIKPQTFMNNSGEVLEHFKSNGIKAENICVIHDELELKFGTFKFKFGGSAKGHNGLKSIINFIGTNFLRLNFGISRPEDKAHVSEYVLSKFSASEELLLPIAIQNSIKFIFNLLAH